MKIHGYSGSSDADMGVDPPGPPSQLPTKAGWPSTSAAPSPEGRRWLQHQGRSYLAYRAPATIVIREAI